MRKNSIKLSQLNKMDLNEMKKNLLSNVTNEKETKDIIDENKNTLNTNKPSLLEAMARIVFAEDTPADSNICSLKTC